MPGSETFAERLRMLREGSGLTQEELAERAGLSGKAVSLLERGERTRPYPHTVTALAEALGLSNEDRSALVASVERSFLARSPAPDVRRHAADAVAGSGA